MTDKKLSEREEETERRKEVMIEKKIYYMVAPSVKWLQDMFMMLHLQQHSDVSQVLGLIMHSLMHFAHLHLKLNAE